MNMHKTPMGTALAAFLALSACGSETAPTPATPAEAEREAGAVDAPVPGTLAWAASGEWRGENSERDTWRNPVQTLEFFGVQPGDTVIELWPGGGWYTQILAPYLAASDGRLVAATWDPAAFEGERRAGIEGRIADYAAAFGDVETFGEIGISALSGTSGDLVEPGTADTVLTFRNIHNWMSGGYLEKVFADSYAALKPGGTFGVVEHRLPSTREQDPAARSGYVHEDFVIAAAERAGFVLEARSEINANPADTADHPFGVWTLPPNSRTSDREGNAPEGFDPAIYEAIGESDRMTLKFRKPE
jgi:predicted methyltransferase